MIDPIGASLTAIVQRSPAAVGLLFVAGVLTSIGPCVAPRYIALTALTTGHRRPAIPTLVFIGGLLGAILALGFAADAAASLARTSSLVYTVFAAGLLASGIVTIVRAVPHRCATPHPAGIYTAAHCSDHDTRTAQTDAGERRGSLGAIFLLGASSALIVSPCCTPVVGAIVATTSAIDDPLLGVLLLTAFALGHAVPLVLAGSLTGGFTAGLRTRLQPRFARPACEQAPAIIAGALLLILGAYYGVLA